MVHRLDQTDTADLKQVVRILVSGGEALYNAEHQPIQRTYGGGRQQFVS